MTLIKSISGIRGTIGGIPEENLTPLDVVRYTSAYGQWLLANHNTTSLRVVTGRDARISGAMVHQLVNQTLVGLGLDVITLDLSTTPTVAMAVMWEEAAGGIIITASHNPKEWNALKLLNNKGEFIDAQSGEDVLRYAQTENFPYASVDSLGSISSRDNALSKHIEATLSLPILEVDKIREQGFKVVVDAVNSSGGIAIPLLLEALGAEAIPLYCEPTGHFPHNPEPLKEHLTELARVVVAEQADFGIAVDPDVDRLVFMDETGTLFGEEYTLVACADYVLQKTPGTTVSNLSSTRALAEVSQQYNQSYYASAVGEVNVVQLMKAK
ncbi:MAG: phosphoglucosamine mutase, partial [Flavobacteriaceae bacterium]